MTDAALKDSPLYTFWKEFDGKLITIQGIVCRILVKQYFARYYNRQVVNALAYPINSKRGKQSSAYLARRREYGDDWFFDLTTFSDDELEKVFKQIPETK